MLIYPSYSELFRQLVAISETLLGANGQLVKSVLQTFNDLCRCPEDG